MDSHEENEWFFLQFKNSFTFYAQKDDILDPSLEIKQGYFGVLEGLSLGIEINEEKLRQYQT